MTGYRLVVGPSVDGSPPHVERVPIVGFKLIGAAETEPSPDELRDEIMFDLRDRGLGPEPIFSRDDDGEYLCWPDLSTWLLDPAYARVLALASLPLGRVVPELDSQPGPDPEHEAEVEKLVQQDRLDHAAVVELVEGVAAAWHARAGVRRRLRRAQRLAAKVKTKRPTGFYEGERDRTGGDWKWTKLVPGPRLRARGRVRPHRGGE